jgi:hypothetical protein
LADRVLVEYAASRVDQGLSDRTIRAPSPFRFLYYLVMLRMLDFLAAAAIARPATAAIYELMPG